MRFWCGQGEAHSLEIAMEAAGRLKQIVQSQPYPILFATVSGAHLYGFPSPDSDFDLRGVHVPPLDKVIGLDAQQDTIEVERKDGPFELDLVTHDALKFFQLLLRRNGYVLEQLLSPLVVHTTCEHEELKALSPGCITQHHAHHYLGFADTQWKLFEKEQPRRVKPLLYVYRVLLTGIHLMRTGRVEASLVRLNDELRLPWISDLIARKTAGPEHGALSDVDAAFHAAQYERLTCELKVARDASALPEAPTARASLNDLLLRIRLRGLTPIAA